MGVKIFKTAVFHILHFMYVFSCREYFEFNDIKDIPLRNFNVVHYLLLSGARKALMRPFLWFLCDSTPYKLLRR